MQKKKNNTTAIATPNNILSLWVKCGRLAAKLTNIVVNVQQLFKSINVLCIVHKLSIQLSTFVKNFDTNGPGAVGPNMDQGITLMEQYGEQFKLLEQQRQEFGRGFGILPSVLV